MKEIEVYDILTLDNDEEYIVIKKTTYSGKEYLLLSPIDKKENLDLENIKIVEKVMEDNELTVEIVEDRELIEGLSRRFQKLLNKNK